MSKSRWLILTILLKAEQTIRNNESKCFDKIRTRFISNCCQMVSAKKRFSIEHYKGYPKEDGQRYEIIWMVVQYYISEEKKYILRKYSRKKKIGKNEIVQQLKNFTPKWDGTVFGNNSIGRLWIGTIQSTPNGVISYPLYWRCKTSQKCDATNRKGKGKKTINRRNKSNGSKYGFRTYVIEKHLKS